MRGVPTLRLPDTLPAVASTRLFWIFRITNQPTNIETMETLHLIHKPHSSFPNGLWVPADHISHEIALNHFSGGCAAIGYDRLDEIIYIAGLHGWKVTTEGDPKFPGENAKCAGTDASEKTL